MATVELIYDNDCPNVTEARAQLLRAFTEAGMIPNWTEWERGDPASPDYARSYGSPTILVGGKDVVGEEASENISCCRLYMDSSNRFQGVPALQDIVSALRAVKPDSIVGKRSGRKGSWRGYLTAFPGVACAFLPNLACPACWPAYAGLLSVLGLGFLLNSAYLFYLTVLFLAIAVVSLGFRAKARRGYKPFGLGLLAGALILIGKFGLESGPVMYAGVALFVAAALWNGWPRKTNSSGNCGSCVPESQSS